MTYLPFVLLSVFFLNSEATSSGTFWWPRGHTCHKVSSTSSSATLPVTASCLSFDWADFHTYTNSYTSIRDEHTHKSYKLYQGTFPVRGSFNSSFCPTLSFTCPPSKYRGYNTTYSTECHTETDETVMLFYVGLTDGLLHGIDVLLSGAPFPENPAVNEPPFGVVRFKFN